MQQIIPLSFWISWSHWLHEILSDSSKEIGDVNGRNSTLSTDELELGLKFVGRECPTFLKGLCYKVHRRAFGHGALTLSWSEWEKTLRCIITFPSSGVNQGISPLAYITSQRASASNKRAWDWIWYEWHWLYSDRIPLTLGASLPLPCLFTAIGIVRESANSLLSVSTVYFCFPYSLCSFEAYRY